SRGSEAVVTIRLEAGHRDPPEGDLSVALLVDGAVLHRINFTWLADPQSGTVTPFLTASQAVRPTSKTEAARLALQRDFPQNSAAFFCFAAIEGIAGVVGCTAVLAVRSHQQVCSHKGQDAAQFERSYDDFWRALGGGDVGRQGFLIPLPAHQR